MNLFVLDTDPNIAPQLLDDKRIGTALREANQLLSTAVHRHVPDAMEYGVGLGCKPTHKAHPVTLWVGATRSNWQWCLTYAYACSAEWQVRYGTKHGSAERTPYIGRFIGCIPDGPLLPFQNSARHEGFGLDYSHLPVPESYRAYLQERWTTDKRAATYKNRGWPEWAQPLTV